MLILNLVASSRIVFSLVVPVVTTTDFPARSRNDLIDDPVFTISLVPAMKITGEKSTTFLRLRLDVVEAHSRSTWPLVTALMRVSDVTGTHLMTRLRPTSVLMASTMARQRSIE